MLLFIPVLGMARDTGQVSPSIMILLFLLLPIYTNPARIFPEQDTPSYVSSPLGNLPRNPPGTGKTPLGVDPPGWQSGSHLLLAAGKGCGPGAPALWGPRAAGLLRDGSSSLLAQPGVAMAMAGYCFLTAPWLAQSQPPAPALLGSGMCSAYQALLPFLRPQLGAHSGACGEEAAGAGASCLFPTAGKPQVFAAACSCSQCSCADPSCLLLHPRFSVAKFSLRCFFHLLPVTYTGGIPPNLSKA